MATQSVILITGSSGLIGRALCHRFGSNGAQVIGFDNEGPPYPPPKTDCIFVDLTSDESVQAGMFMLEERYGRRIEAVIHLAAYYSFSGVGSSMYEKLTFQGTQRLLRELQRFDVGQFIFSSTMLVHHPGLPGQRINEDSPLSATWAYPASKIRTEELIRQSHGAIPVVIMRIAGVYTDLCESIPLAQQIQRMYEGKLTSHIYPGDTSAAQSYVHLDDVVDAFALAIQNRAQLPEFSVFLIGEADAMTYDELQHEIGFLLYGGEWTTQHVPKTLAKAGAWLQGLVPLNGQRPFIRPWMVDRADDNYVIDTRKAREMLGWTTQRSLGETLPRMIEGLKEDPIRWYRINKLVMPESRRRKDRNERLRKSA